MASGGLGAKTACVAFLSNGAVGLVCAARGPFPVPLQTAASRSWFGATGEPGPRCCAAQLGSGGINGAWAKKAFAGPVLLPHEGENFEGGFQALETPSKASGPRSSVGAVGETGPRCCAVQLDSGGIAGAWAQLVCAARVAFPVPLQTTASRSSVGAVRGTGNGC